MNIDPIILLFSLAFGAIVGSFLNVVILRLPQEHGSLLFPASHCPSCKKPLSWYENIPIISYIFLLGKCRGCKTSISIQYPLVELLMALLSGALFHTFGVSATTAGYFLFCAILLCIIWIDIHHQIIPDKLSLSGICVGFIFSFINTEVSWQSSLLGIAAGGGFLYLVALGYLLLRKQEGMGGGDIKLLAMIGGFLGWQSLLFVIFFSSLTGTVVGITAMQKQKKGGSTRIPFGPFLSMAALVYLFFNEQIHNYFLLYSKGELF